jgi:hypothetical protein
MQPQVVGGQDAPGFLPVASNASLASHQYVCSVFDWLELSLRIRISY